MAARAIDPQDDTQILRIFRCRPLRGAFDEILREVLVPQLRLRPGISAVYVGRQGPDDVGSRLIASLWTSRAAMIEAMGTDIEASKFVPEHLAETVDHELDVLPLSIALRFATTDTPRILRLAEGKIAAGQLSEYVRETREGADRDASTRHGPLALYLSEQLPSGFVTLSAWRSWSDIEAATGADVRRPVTTQRADRLTAFHATHYEAIDSAAETTAG
ncbi:MAG TPA: hypothetical protein VID26_12400 [Candidatus Limnocylindrales bacterium]|jgi:hypothetical protein